MPFEFHGVKFGAVGGRLRRLPAGQQRRLIPTAAIEGRNWGLNIAVVPSIKNRLYGAVSFQLKYRFSGPE